MQEKVKPHIARLPRRKYPNPKSDSKEVAISIPLFFSNTDTGLTDFNASRLKEIHAKGAIWSAISIINNTDLTKNGVGIYFHIEDEIADTLSSVFDDFGVTKEAIRIISTPKSETPNHIKHPHYGKKFMCLEDSEIATKRWLVMDSDAFICSAEKPLAWYDSLSAFVNPSVLISKAAGYNSENMDRWVSGICLAMGLPFSREGDLKRQENRAFYEAKLFDNPHGFKLPKTRHYIASQMALIPMQHPIADFIKSYYANCYQDEFLLAMWHCKHRDISSLRVKLGEFPYYLHESRYTSRDKQMDKNGYLAHIMPDDKTEMKDVETWYDDFYNGLESKPGTPHAITSTPPVVEALAKTSDKESDKGHKYGKMYDLILNAIAMKVNRKLRICEIGVSFYGEGSLKAFSELDIIESVVGVDVIPYAPALPENATFLLSDAYSLETVRMLSETHQKFDLIIDDGSHNSKDQEFFIKHYGQLLSEHGKLVCEDVHDANFFKRMCRDEGCYGFDGWSNIGARVDQQHDERMLIKDLTHLPTVKASVKHPKIYPVPRTNHKLTLHLLSLPYAKTDREFNTCPFVQRVWKSCEMFTDIGYHTIHYGHKDSQVSSVAHVPVTDDSVLEKAYGRADYDFPPKEHDINDHAFKTFRENAEVEIRKRAKKDDLVLAFYGQGHKVLCDAISDLPVHVIEPSIGYPDPFSKNRVYQSIGYMHFNRGQASHAERIQRRFPDNPKLNITPWNVISENIPQWNDCVIPNFFNVDDFEYSEEKEDWFCYIGRIHECKGLKIIFDLAEATDTHVKIAGPGDVQKLGVRVPKQIEFLGIADRQMRKDLFKRAKALICPSLYLEPFLGTHVECLFAGTPVITVNFGAPMEYCDPNVTGFRCMNMDHFMYAVKNIHEIDPAACRQHSLKFTMKRAVISYHEYFHTVIRNKSAGWHSYDPTRDNLDWLTKDMTEPEINDRYTVIKESVLSESRTNLANYKSS